MIPPILPTLGLTLALLLVSGPAAAEADDDGHAQSDDDKKAKVPRSKLPRMRAAVANPTLNLKNRAQARVDGTAGGSDSDTGDNGNAASGAAAGGNSGSTGRGAAGGSAAAATSSAAGSMKAGTGPRKTLPPFDPTVLIHIDYDAADIKDVIKDFAEKTGRNFLIDPKISGKVTIIAPQPVSIEEAYEAFLAALDAAGFTTVVEARFRSGKFKGKPMLTRILSAADARSEPLELYTGAYTPRSANLITRLIQVENIPVDEISRVIQKWVSKNGDLIAYAPSNTLILTDSANNIRRILELITELDISAPQQEMEIFQIEHAEASALVEIIRDLYGDDSSSSKSTSKATKKSRRNKGKKKGKKKTSSASSTSVGEETSFIGKMISDDRTNSIIVLATEKSLQEISDLIARLDYETDPFAQSDIQVIYLEHAKAEELSQTLNSLIQQSNQRATQRKAKKGKGKDKAAQLRGGKAGSLGGNFQDEVRITHDAPTNALVVTASRDDYRRLRKVINLLDIPRKQVFVETVIMEISDSDRRDTGASWHGGRPGKGERGINILGARGSQSLNLGAALLDGSLLGGLALGVFGQSINVPLPGIEGGLDIPAFGVVLRALQEDSSTNVLSSPSILTLDNEEATIEIGETVPFPTGGSLGALAGAAGAAGGFGGFPSISFSREDVGIILRITPQINESDYVTMDVYQEISEVKEGSAADTLTSGGPITTKRSAETHVMVRSNQTIVIGGLMQEVETESESKVPILGDIPLIGFFFRNKAKTKRKTNLLIFLTPHVIDSPEDLQEVYRIKMLQRQEFMRRFYGKTHEEQLEELNKLIRFSMNLPDTPSVYRDQEARINEVRIDMSADLSDEELIEALENVEPGDQSTLVTAEGVIDLPDDEIDLPDDEIDLPDDEIDLPRGEGDLDDEEMDSEAGAEAEGEGGADSGEADDEQPPAAEVAAPEGR
jgi:general secretion pathway protein D